MQLIVINIQLVKTTHIEHSTMIYITIKLQENIRLFIVISTNCKIKHL